MTILIITYILNVIDYLETLYLIQRYGIAVEGNPIMRFLFEHPYGWVAKLIVPAILFTICALLAIKDKRILYPVYIAAVVYVGIVLHNLNIILQAGLL